MSQFWDWIQAQVLTDCLTSDLTQVTELPSSFSQFLLLKMWIIIHLSKGYCERNWDHTRTEATAQWVLLAPAPKPPSEMNTLKYKWLWYQSVLCSELKKGRKRRAYERGFEGQKIRLWSTCPMPPILPRRMSRSSAHSLVKVGGTPLSLTLS